MPTTTAQVIDFPQTDALQFLPEGPFWLGENRVSWVAIQHAADKTVGSLNVLELSHSGLSASNQEYTLPGRPGFAFPTDRKGIFVIGIERQVGWFDTESSTFTPFCHGVDADVDNTIVNDGVICGENLIFGTKDLEFKTKKAGLYLFRKRDHQLIRLRADQLCSNGKAVQNPEDADQVSFFDIDSPTRTVVRYDLEIASGHLSDPEIILDFEGDPAVPDGQVFTPDKKCLVVAMFHPGFKEAGETRVYEISSGKLLQTIQTPGSPQNTCPLLCMVDGKVHVMITTAVENLSADDLQRCPNAGRLFLAPLDLGADHDSELAVSPEPTFPYFE